MDYSQIDPCVIEEITWDKARLEIKRVNPELFNIIEQISPSNKFKLLKARYLYGENITDLGTICVPDKQGKLARLNDPDVCEKLKEQLGYCPTPLTLQLSNASEVFVEAGDRIIPLNVFTPGDLFGLFEAIVPLTGCPIHPCWSVTSGGRSVFFAPKITETIGHQRLQSEFRIRQGVPKKLSEHWNIFKIINKHNEQKTWTSDVMIFPKEWFKKHTNDIDWMRFQNYLLTKAWLQSKNTRVKSRATS